MAENIEGKPKLLVKHDWYQTEATVVLTVMVKSVSGENLKIGIEEKQVKVRISQPEFEICDLCFNLSHRVDPSQSSYKLSATKIEIKLKKTDGIRWEELEGIAEDDHIKTISAGPAPKLDKPPAYPTSKKGKDWSAVEKDIKNQEAQEKPEGDEAINKLFQEIYGKGSDEVKKAMNKSYMESGGTVLSTNWDEISKKTVDVKPPDGMEFKKWND